MVLTSDTINIHEITVSFSFHYHSTNFLHVPRRSENQWRRRIRHTMFDFLTNSFSMLHASVYAVLMTHTELPHAILNSSQSKTSSNVISLAVDSSAPSVHPQRQMLPTPPTADVISGLKLAHTTITLACPSVYVVACYRPTTACVRLL